ncbi:MAG: hypothetical protein J7K40_07860, partial [candidate division Zixibacteria bacterium]|nr:hypothetical protein [candidate division Zixibacteria bacterium]
MKQIILIIGILLMISSVNANEIITIDCDSCTTNKTININTTCIICNTNRSVEIAINNGMNLIGIPLYPTDPTLDAVFGDDPVTDDTVYRYINGVGYKAAQYWEGYGWYGDVSYIEPIEPGVGYKYERNGADYTLTVNGTYLPNNGYNNSKCISFKQKMINKTINLTTSYDGFVIKQMDSSYPLDFSSSFISIGKINDIMTDKAKGFAEFDISTIPKNANITNITFRYNGRIHNMDCNISNMTIQPSNSSGEIIFNNIGSYEDYFNNSDFPVIGTNQSINLGLCAINDLQLAINESNWFSIGFYTDSSISPPSIINASENIDATPPPTLTIEYQVPAEPDREELNIMFHEYNMHINI